MEFMNVGNLHRLLCACFLLFSLLLECPLASKPFPAHFVVRVLAQSPSTSPPRATGAGARLRRVLLGVLFGSLTGILLSLFTVFLFRFLLHYLNRTPILKGPVIFSPKISPRTLRQALADGARELGSSPNGKYYRVVLDNGLVVAVKRLEPMNEASPPSRSSDRRMQRELELLAQIRHRHLMTLRAYVREPDRFSIVYDYVANGSLEDVMNRLRSNQLQLNWESRHRIAVGIVKGLWYLHYGCGRTILHYDLKPSNVLLDEELEPRLGDCGLSKLLPCVGRDGSPFVAPECLQSCRLNTSTCS